MKNGKSGLVLLLLILCAIIIGGFLGEFFKGSSLLGFLSWGFPIGTTDQAGHLNPLVLNLKMLELSFGFLVNINLVSIIAIISGIWVYRKL